jgi:hypothetical protein
MKGRTRYSNCFVDVCTSRLQLLAGQLGEPALDLVDPRCRCRREVDTVVQPASEESPDRCGPVGRVILHDDVEIEIGRHLALDLLEKVEKLVRPMPLVASADDEAQGDVER